MDKRTRIEELVSDYWDVAHVEGAEGRTHDTPEGDAQRVLSDIRAALADLEADAFRRGSEAVAGKLTGEVERLRPHYLTMTGTDQARRQMLDHFAKFADKVSPVDRPVDPEPTGDIKPS